jgi:hypothetical protein
MRLNGWQRIGIVASILWLVVGGFWINSLVIDDLSKFVLAAYGRCLESRSIQPDGSIPADTDWGPCQRKFEADWPVALKDHWTITTAERARERGCAPLTRSEAFIDPSLALRSARESLLAIKAYDGPDL